MSNYRYQEVAEKYLTIVLRSGTEYMCGCYACGGSDCLQFNVAKGLFCCFSCGERGTARRMVKKMGEVWTEPAASVEYLQAKLDFLVNPPAISRQDPIPEATLRRYGGTPHRYWIKRGFTPETIQAWSLGYDPLTGCCTIPYRTPEGSLLGVILRRIDNGFPKYKYPKGFDRAHSLFGSWRVTHRHSTVAVVEGSLDAVSCWQAGVPALAQYGSSLSRGQVDLLKRIGVRRVVLMYDNDTAGIKATQTAHEMLDGHAILVKDVQYPDGFPSDPGGMNTTQVQELFGGVA